MGKDNIVSPEHVGNWRLISLVVEFQDTGEKLSLPWNGREITLADGTHMLLFTQSGRRPGITQEDQAAALAGTVALSGTLRSEGNVCIYNVDLAAIPQVEGIEGRITNEFLGNRKRSMSEWTVNPKRGNRVTRNIFEFERE